MTNTELTAILRSFCCSTFDLAELDALEPFITDPTHRAIADRLRASHPHND